MTSNKYEVVIGLEVHAQLLTNSKLFCGDPTRFGADANTQVSPLTLAHPGTLPVMNEAVIYLALQLGMALKCEIVQDNFFARKNYFYPDLPKAYQVSQHTAPICRGGYLSIKSDDGYKDIHLNRIHIEEDAGKSIHDRDAEFTCIDLNRAGIPLLEIVTEPCIHSARDAYSFLTELRRLLRWLQVCDGNMEEGSMRCDANISIRPTGSKTLGTRVEVKNLNSIRNVKLAIEIEINRLINITEKGENIVQETRSFDADKASTFSLRNKEEAEDYRYFPEPDLPPFKITDEQLQNIKNSLPELPYELIKKYTTNYGLSLYDAEMICSDKDDMLYFESIIALCPKYKAVANWLQGPIRSYCNEQQLSLNRFPLPVPALCSLIELNETGKVSFSNAGNKILHALIASPVTPALEIATQLNLLQENNSDAIDEWVNQVLENLPDKVKAYKAGKKALLGLFCGEVKKISKGKADMQLAQRILLEKLSH